MMNSIRNAAGWSMMILGLLILCLALAPSFIGTFMFLIKLLWPYILGVVLMYVGFWLIR